MDTSGSCSVKQNHSEPNNSYYSMGGSWMGPTLICEDSFDYQAFVAILKQRRADKELSLLFLSI